MDPALGGGEALIGDPAQQRGFIRLFAFPGLDNGLMRDGGQAWDRGGIFDINVYSLGAIGRLHGRMTRAGFRPFGPVTAYDFSGLGVKEVIECDSDGLAIALIEQIVPPLKGFEGTTGAASFVFNSTQTVPSFAAARAFYVDVLGWHAVHETSWTHVDGRNCLGLPLDVARSRHITVGVYQAEGQNLGSVEILEVEGEGLDFSASAPPARGWAALRFPVSDPADFLARAGRGGAWVLPLRRVSMNPYGEVEAGLAITPWGARLEVYAPV